MSFASPERRSLVAKIAATSYRHPGHPELSELRRRRGEIKDLEILASALAYYLKEELIAGTLPGLRAGADVTVAVVRSTRFVRADHPDAEVARRTDHADILPVTPPRPVASVMKEAWPWL